MKLPEIFQAGRIVDNLPGGRTRSLAGTVIDDRDLRLKGPDKRLGVGEVSYVLLHQEKIDPTDQIIGTGDRALFLPRQITEIQEAKATVCDENSYGTRVFS